MSVVLGRLLPPHVLQDLAGINRKLSAQNGTGCWVQMTPIPACLSLSVRGSGLLPRWVGLAHVVSPAILALAGVTSSCSVGSSLGYFIRISVHLVTLLVNCQDNPEQCNGKMEMVTFIAQLNMEFPRKERYFYSSRPFSLLNCCN